MHTETERNVIARTLSKVEGAVAIRKIATSVRTGAALSSSAANQKSRYPVGYLLFTLLRFVNDFMGEVFSVCAGGHTVEFCKFSAKETGALKTAKFCHLVDWCAIASQNSCGSVNPVACQMFKKGDTGDLLKQCAQIIWV